MKDEGEMKKMVSMDATQILLVATLCTSGALFSGSASAERAPWRSAKATIYADPDFRGRSAFINHDIPKLSRETRLNDLVSSGRFEGRWEMCSDPYYRGRCEIYEGRVRNVSRSMNDEVSSIRFVGRGGGGGFNPGNNGGGGFNPGNNGGGFNPGNNGDRPSSGQRTYRNPEYRSVKISVCGQSSRVCGYTYANTYCRNHRFDRAQSFKQSSRPASMVADINTGARYYNRKYFTEITCVHR
mmetsp:Transcript_13376/g.19521  ORF Transcript_13376/g.19521 Transcript_13376/m.19521 type:complete len:241 (+) Transcript_13376:1128-1850(+)